MLFGRFTMPGYSGTPLPKKLGIKDGFRVHLVEAPSEVLAELKPSLGKCKIAVDGKAPLDFAMVFTKSARSLKKEFTRVGKDSGTCRYALGQLAEEELPA